MSGFGVAELPVPRVNPFDVHFCLKRISCTACGPDGLPFWISTANDLVLVAPKYHIFNLCLQIGIHPGSSKTAFIQSVPKVKYVKQSKDLRPIS